MREIKFRAWDTEKNQWIYVSLGDLVCGATSKPSVPLGDEFTPADGDQSTNGEFQNWCEYTGLKDKNGKEIYEGDLVEHGRLETGYPLTVKIGGYWPTEGDSGWGVHVHNEDETFVEGVSPFEQDNNLEVIGNIYENPELLQDPISSNER